MKEAYDWIIAGMNMGRWYLGVEKGEHEFEVWGREDKLRSYLRHEREAAALGAATTNPTTATTHEESRMGTIRRVSRFVPDWG